MCLLNYMQVNGLAKVRKGKGKTMDEDTKVAELEARIASLEETVKHTEAELVKQIEVFNKHIAGLHVG